MRILSWNAHGDFESGADSKLAELQEIMNCWEEEDPIEIICLQEISAEGILKRYLEFTMEWDILVHSEQANGMGRYNLIAVRKRSGTLNKDACGILNLIDYHDPNGITNSPSRAPLYAAIEINEKPLFVITWHATLGSRQIEDFVNLSRILDGTLESPIQPYLEENIPVIIGADFNQEYDVMNGAYYREFSGHSHHLDHILGRGIEITNGMHSPQSNSDHMPLSAHFEF